MKFLALSRWCPLTLSCVLALAGADLRAADAPAAPPAPNRGGFPGGPGAARGQGGPRGGQQPAAYTPPGPPAPVPAAVAMLRPSPDELAQINGALRQFIATNTSAARPLLQKYAPLISVPAPRPNTAVMPSVNLGYMTKHNGNLAAITEAKGDIDVLFMGDSITDFWRNAGPAGQDNPAQAGKAVFDQYYGAMKVANFGISGDRTEGVLWRLQNGEGQGFSPKVVELLIGTNNANNAPTNTAPEIAEGVGAVVLELQKDFPTAKILLLAVFPRNAPDSANRKTVQDVNAIISKLDDRQHVFYLDIGSVFLDANGNIPTDIMSDGLHPTKMGYGLWAEAVKKPLANLLK